MLSRFPVGWLLLTEAMKNLHSEERQSDKRSEGKCGR